MHCAASGLQYPPLVPIWGPEAITLQPIRTGFPCFGAALAGYVEATVDGDEEKNTVVPAVAVLEHARGLGADAGAGRPGGDGVRRPTPTSRRGRTGSRSIRRGSRPSWRTPPK